MASIVSGILPLLNGFGVRKTPILMKKDSRISVNLSKPKQVSQNIMKLKPALKNNMKPWFLNSGFVAMAMHPFASRYAHGPQPLHNHSDTVFKSDFTLLTQIQKKQISFPH